MAPDWSAVDERKWLFVSADVRGAGTCDEPLRTSAWEARCREVQPYMIMLHDFSLVL